jgi:hypothetical protein
MVIKIEKCKLKISILWGLQSQALLPFGDDGYVNMRLSETFP